MSRGGCVLHTCSAIAEHERKMENGPMVLGLGQRLWNDLQGSRRWVGQFCIFVVVAGISCDNRTETCIPDLMWSQAKPRKQGTKGGCCNMLYSDRPKMISK